MKKLFVLSILASIFFISCKNTTSNPEVEDTALPPEEVENVALVTYPDKVSQVFEAHGGMEQWNQMNTLSYEVMKGETPELHTVSLKDRRVRINQPDWSIGYDGTQVWLLQNMEDAYEGNARFYHNLYFYFYAMPFVLGDDGIQYELIPNTKLLGKEYEGIKVSYDDGIGDSPKDEYILYFDPTTHKMEWLAYTVTYRSNEKSDRWSFIHYEKWETVNDVLLPKKLTWYTSEENSPKDVRSSMEFQNAKLYTTMPQESVFAMPEGAEVVER
ncbi:DUF6503 family protein [Aureisphaera galaxeae]|uniref:DUF6503 family protein n=1 Tax=Aureisphaera galaxeae TaxID=1538023 RepID=UPI0023504A8C|nr:DUF6503 family protein [Aureisphaera galaxeae]MDC8003464.1 DUF6503 family protein [Aureisphaera galaxeae]